MLIKNYSRSLFLAIQPNNPLNCLFFFSLFVLIIIIIQDSNFYGSKNHSYKKFRTFCRIFSFTKKHHYVKQEFNSDLTFSEQIQSGLEFLFEIFPFRKTYNTGRVIVLLNSLYTMRYVFIKMMQTFNWTVYTFKKVLLLSSTNNCNANVTF